MKKKVFREVPEVVHNAVLDALDSLEENEAVTNLKKRSGNRQKGFYIPKVAVAAVACFLIMGITASAVGIFTLRQRLEDMDASEIEGFYATAMADETTNLSRRLTPQERTRYNQLTQEYKTDGKFPEFDLRNLEEGEVYDGIGVALDPSTRIVYLPEETLTDEELLEIIDFNMKIAYSIHQMNEDRIINGGGWESRMVLMDDAEVDEIYMITCSSNTATSGGYSRMFTEDEKSRYQELVWRYEEEGLYTTSEMTVIWKPEEYDGEEIAICVFDSNYYFPERELSDDELLQLIDFQHKSLYIFGRINDDIMYGLRDGYPPRASFE